MDCDRVAAAAFADPHSLLPTRCGQQGDDSDASRQQHNDDSGNGGRWSGKHDGRAAHADHDGDRLQLFARTDSSKLVPVAQQSAKDARLQQPGMPRGRTSQKQKRGKQRERRGRQKRQDDPGCCQSDANGRS
jgi:hypothetical protein